MFGLTNKNKSTSKFQDQHAKILAAFSKIIIPELNSSVTELNCIRDVAIKDKKLVVDMVLPTFALKSEREIALAVKKAAVENSDFEHTDVDLNCYADVRPATEKSISKANIANVKNVVLVASGKGGVGKSTVASNLAVSLSRLGCRVGLLDADVYGPSMPLMFGIPKDTEVEGFTVEGSKDTFMLPIEKHGIKIMSIGFLVDTSSAMIWRGPMIASASMQMFFNVAWGDLDYLIVDLPPGTGDVQLSISQKVAVAGSVIVSTPQDIALADVIRAKAMFDKVNIPVLGVVENMSYFVCDGCDKRHEIFTHGGVRKAAADLNIPFLGEIPLEPKVRLGGDEGVPLATTLDESMSGKAFKELAHTVATKLVVASQNPPVHVPVQPGGSKPVPSSPAKKGLPIL